MTISNSLRDKDINDILQSQGVKLKGIYMKDELPKKLKTGFYVVNLQSSFQGNGTHWTAFYYNPKLSMYFDSYGYIPPLEVEEKIKPYIYNDIDIQSYSSTACGYFCIAFILYMNAEKNKLKGFKDFVEIFSIDTRNNDKKLYRLLYY